jgi:glutathione S-transferase
MRRLHHFALHPASRKLRLILKEKSLDFVLETENYWQRRDAFLKFNPSGEVPVLEDEGAAVIADVNAIEEYLEERYPDPPLIGADPAARAETRRLSAWFDQKFQREVTANLFDQKVIRRLKGAGGPDSQAIRNGLANIRYHLDYIGWLADRRNWLAGEHLTLADLAAAAQLSVLDYIGDVPWEAHPQAKDWYARVKSRPSFRPLLSDTLPGFAPPAHYADLDF